MKKSDNPKRMANGAYIYYMFWLARETSDFNDWWEHTYPMMDVLDTADDLETDAADEYYRRKSFALMGWLAEKENPDQSNETTTVKWLIEHIAVLGINLRDEADCVDAATESFVALPDHLQEMINEKEAKIDKFNF